MLYEKWRDLSIDPLNINFENIKIEKIVSFPPAGNDVIECECLHIGQAENVFIKIERSKLANFNTEIKHLELLHKNNYDKAPTIIETCTCCTKKVIVLKKVFGERLSDIINIKNKKDYLIKYGQELARIHNIPNKGFDLALQRKINDYPKIDNYGSFDNFIAPYIEHLRLHKPEMNHNCFIHGDFHYANILWENNEISGVLDFEYSGKGLKEQDIAWSVILRPNQTFMNNISDINTFMNGYSKYGTYDEEVFKWCLLNGYCHFYLMNINNKKYVNKIKRLIVAITTNDINCKK